MISVLHLRTLLKSPEPSEDKNSWKQSSITRTSWNTSSAFLSLDSTSMLEELPKLRLSSFLKVGGPRNQPRTCSNSSRTWDQTSNQKDLMQTSAWSLTSQFTELSKAEEELSELMVESLPTSPPTATLNSSALKGQRQSRSRMIKQLDLPRNKLPRKDSPSEKSERA